MDGCSVSNIMGRRYKYWEVQRQLLSVPMAMAETIGRGINSRGTAEIAG